MKSLLVKTKRRLECDTKHFKFLIDYLTYLSSIQMHDQFLIAILKCAKA